MSTWGLPNEASCAVLEIVPGATESNAYWRFTWQNEERRYLVELDTPGRGVTFDSDDPEDAARWLREPEAEA